MMFEAGETAYFTALTVKLYCDIVLFGMIMAYIGEGRLCARKRRRRNLKAMATWIFYDAALLRAFVK